MKDCLIIGASAAGISAAIYLHRQGLDFALIGRDLGGEMALSGEIENYPGIAHTNGVELTKKFQDHLEAYKITVELGTEVKTLSKNPTGYSASITQRNSLTELSARTIIIATGSTPKKLSVPNESELYHRGISYCTVCDGPVMRGKPVAIIGGGNSALEAALMMSNLSPQVFLLTKNPAMVGDTVLIQEVAKKSVIKLIPNAETQGFLKEGNFLSGLEYQDRISHQAQTLSVAGAFIHIGLRPNSYFIPDEWEIKNSIGEIIVDRLGQTSLPGIFAAGDVTDIPYKQIGVAAGMGIAAALSAINFLNKHA